MLFIHDVHALIGEREFEFEDSVRDEYAPAVAKDGARLIWYLHGVHGAGEAYKVVTITAVPDGATWQRLGERQAGGDLAEWRERVDTMRYGSTSSLLVQTDWSPLQSLDLDAVDVARESEIDPVVFREDTLSGPGVAEVVPDTTTQGPNDLLCCVAAFRPALEPGGMVRILYRAPSMERWTATFGTDFGASDWPGSLTLVPPANARVTSRILRTTPWSPLA